MRKRTTRSRSEAVHLTYNARTAIRAYATTMPFEATRKDLPAIRAVEAAFGMCGEVLSRNSIGELKETLIVHGAAVVI